MPTPHNTANKGDIAKTVLMPGDPLRAKFIAERYLENPVLFNEVRGMLGYTGTYRGEKISVMGHGMGMPSVGIYSYELFTHYDVQEIVRIGSCGSYDEKLKVFDLLLVTEAYSESTFAKVQSGCNRDCLCPNEALTERLRKSAKEQRAPLAEGRVHCTDVFYNGEVAEGESPYWEQVHENRACLAVEMESFALFHTANVTGKQAACVLTVSDSFVSQTEATAKEREQNFTCMVEVALAAAVTTR